MPLEPSLPPRHSLRNSVLKATGTKVMDIYCCALRGIIEMYMYLESTCTMYVWL